MSAPSRKTKVYRVSVPDQANSIAIPSDVSNVILRNASTTISVRFNFDSDSASDYFTLTPGEMTPAFEVKNGKTLNTDGINGSAVLEIITWG